MSNLSDARTRVAAILDEIDRLKQSEFPYRHIRDALVVLEVRFKWHQSVLAKASPTSKSSATRNACRESLRELKILLPILGFLLRATNVRNAFEAYGPLQSLTRRILGNDAKLIVSSEWEFSPYVYRSSGALPDFVLIGLPASESSNPFLLPLAGHELGHSIWGHESYDTNFDKDVEDEVLKELLANNWDNYHIGYPQYTKDQLKYDLEAKLTWRPAYTWALLQIEEMFCDFVGLRMFAKAYLYAFAYLLSPGALGQRSFRYPNIVRRVRHLVEAANTMGIDVPTDYAGSFAAEPEPTDSTLKFLVAIADVVSASLAPKLIQLANEFALNKRIPFQEPVAVESIVDCFGLCVPVRKPATLIDLVNAGWQCKLDETLWRDVDQIRGANDDDFERNRERVLRDIILKSMEIIEIHERLKEEA